MARRKHWDRNAPRIAVIDIDPRNGGLETFENLEADLGRLPKTPMALTDGDGGHLMFNLPRIAVCKAAAGPGVEVRGCGALIDVLVPATTRG